VTARIQAVLLDLGNVLIFHDNQLLFRCMGERAGISAPEVEARIGGRLWNDVHRGELEPDEIRSAVCGALGLNLSSDQFGELWNCHFRVNEPMVRQVEGLVGKVKLGALSNTNALHTGHFQAQLPILKAFDQLLFSHELRMMKPEPAIFIEALRRLGTPAEATAFFDDIPEYVEAARSLGLRAERFRSAADFPTQLRRLGLGGR